MSTRLVNNLNLINGMIAKKRNEKSLIYVNQQKKKHYQEKYVRKINEESVTEFENIEPDDEIKIPVIQNKNQKEKENLLKKSSIQKLICSIDIQF